MAAKGENTERPLCVLSHRMNRKLGFCGLSLWEVPESGVLGGAAGAHIGRHASIETSEDRPATGPEEYTVEGSFRMVSNS